MVYIGYNNIPVGSSMSMFSSIKSDPSVTFCNSICVEDEKYKTTFWVHGSGLVEVSGELSAETIRCKKIITSQDIGKRLSSEIILRDGSELSLEKDISFCMNNEPITVILPKGEDGQVKYINNMNGKKITIHRIVDVDDIVNNKEIILEKINSNVTFVYNECIGLWIVLNSCRVSN